VLPSRTMTVSAGYQAAGGVEAVYHQLRALRIAHDEGWCEYVAADLAEARHVLGLSTGYRTLIRGEAWWWCRGLAAGYGRDQLVLDVLGEQMPELLTTADAAKRIPAVDRWSTQRGPWMSSDGIAYQVNKGTLYPLYGPGRLRYLFVDQVDALALGKTGEVLTKQGQTRAQLRAIDEAQTEADTARQRWLKIRALLPPLVRLGSAAVEVDVTPRPSPRPLPVPKETTERSRRAQALMIGNREGWFRFVHPPLDDDTDPYVVEVVDADGDTVQLGLPHEGVLPWLLGIADRHGQGAKVAHRPGLG
jgi:hypothetical protein